MYRWERGAFPQKKCEPRHERVLRETAHGSLCLDGRVGRERILEMKAEADLEELWGDSSQVLPGKRYDQSSSYQL